LNPCADHCDGAVRPNAVRLSIAGGLRGRNQQKIECLSYWSLT
jgi:hypothetical protein